MIAANETLDWTWPFAPDLHEVPIADFQGVWRDRPIVQLPGAGHFCQEDGPDTLVALIEQFVQSNP